MHDFLAQAITSTTTHAKSWFDLRLLDFTENGFELRIGLFWVILLGVGIFAGRWLWYLIRPKIWKRFRARSVRLSFSGPEVEICPDHETRRIAHQAWVEMRTRKVALPFDDKEDLLIHIYKSWYHLFGVLRDLCKTIPPECLADEDAQKLIQLLLECLNLGLRPHLTKWGTKFQYWYEQQVKDHGKADIPPNQLQRQYPHYDDLVADLKTVNIKLVRFADSLSLLAKGGV